MKEDEKKHMCGNCALCIRTYLGCECNITDNTVDECQDGCIDWIDEEESDYENVCSEG